MVSDTWKQKQVCFLHGDHSIPVAVLASVLCACSISAPSKYFPCFSGSWSHSLTQRHSNAPVFVWVPDHWQSHRFPFCYWTSCQNHCETPRLCSGLGNNSEGRVCHFCVNWNCFLFMNKGVPRQIHWLRVLKPVAFWAQPSLLCFWITWCCQQTASTPVPR